MPLLAAITAVAPTLGLPEEKQKVRQIPIGHSNAVLLWTLANPDVAEFDTRICSARSCYQC